MLSLKSPGVYIREVDYGAEPTEVVGTSTATSSSVSSSTIEPVRFPEPTDQVFHRTVLRATGSCFFLRSRKQHAPWV